MALGKSEAQIRVEGWGDEFFILAFFAYEEGSGWGGGIGYILSLTIGAARGKVACSLYVKPNRRWCSRYTARTSEQ